MNGRDNEVIMCVYQGLSGSSYNTHSIGEGSRESVIIIIIAAHSVFVLTLHRYNWFSAGA